MAKKDNQDQSNMPSKNILSRLFSLRNQMNGIYKDTYSTDPTHREELDRITTNIEDNLSKIVSRNGGTEQLSNITRLYSAANLKSAVNNKEYIHQITDFFENRSVTDAIIGSYAENKWIKELDNEIDLVCKYMPKLTEALEAIKDSVLCADNFEKEYATFSSANIGPDEQAAFNEEMATIKDSYNLYDKMDEWYMNTSKYGEQFVYNVPYNKALNILLDRKNNGYIANNGQRFYQETTLISESSGCVRPTDPMDIQLWRDANEDLKKSSLGELKLEINKGGILSSAVNEATQLRKLIPLAESVSVNEAYQEFDKVIPDKFDSPDKLKDTSAMDGLISANGVSREKSNVKIPGVLLKNLERGNIIMLYMDDVCLGYYYIEFLDADGIQVFSDSIFTRRSLSNIGYSASAKSEDMQSQASATDELLKYLSGTIAASIDDKFVNNNAYLRKEIYAVLKYNDICNASGLDRIRVTYLAPEDVEHITFQQDPDTHRGISDLLKALIPAKLWCCLYIANTLGILTRGQDKRVYYVKQNVEQNIAQTLLNVINQIKKQNFNIMQIENMNSILGITGKYNDYIIPVGPSGDSPISMEVMEGQNIDPQTELLDKLEETAVSSTGIPYELVVARLNLDFATQLTMSNTKFLRFVFKRQTKFEQHISNIITKIYNYEHGDKNKQYIDIEAVLPSPLMLNVNNLNQIMDLVNQQADVLSQLEYPDDSDESTTLKRAIFKTNYVHSKLGGYLKQNEIELLKNMTDLQYAKQKKAQDENQ